MNRLRRMGMLRYLPRSLRFTRRPSSEALGQQGISIRHFRRRGAGGKVKRTSALARERRGGHPGKRELFPPYGCLYLSRAALFW